MTTNELKKALSLGVQFRFQIVGTLERNWSVWCGLLDDRKDPGAWIELANNRGMKTYPTIDAALKDIFKQHVGYGERARDYHRRFEIIF